MINIISLIVLTLCVVGALIYAKKLNYLRKERITKNETKTNTNTDVSPEKVSALFYATAMADSFHMERAITINASPEIIIAYLIDFQKWVVWSPWESRDHGIVRAFSGAASGKGAVYDWSGNSKVGLGRMEILDVQPEGIKIKFDLLKPFEAHNTLGFSIEQQGEETKVTWFMFGPKRHTNKVMSEVMSMDKMVGSDFEVGLAKLKAAAEN